MSLSALLVGLDRMATLAATRRPVSNSLSACVKATESAPDTGTRRNRPATQSRHSDARNEAARKAVAVAFARIVAERYPGTSWLPVKPYWGNDGLIVPTGKIVRLLPDPANVNTSSRIGHPAAPAACERTPYEYRSNPGT